MGGWVNHSQENHPEIKKMTTQTYFFLVGVSGVYIFKIDPAEGGGGVMKKLREMKTLFSIFLSYGEKTKIMCGREDNINRIP